MTKELTGRHVLIIVFIAFATIIAANMTMLFAATGSFPGLVVGNSYVESQGWNKRAGAQRQLGWTAEVSYHPGALRIVLRDSEGHLVHAQPANVVIGRPANADSDRLFHAEMADGALRVPVELSRGRWRIAIAIGDPVVFKQTAEVFAGSGG